MKNKTKILLSSFAVIAFASSITAGSTAALFTDKDEANIAISSGKVDVRATADVTALYSAMAKVEYDALIDKPVVETVDDHIVSNLAEDGYLYYNRLMSGMFATGGTAVLTGNTLTLANVVAGDKAVVSIAMEDDSNVSIKYRYVVECISTEDEDLEFFTHLDFTLNGAKYTNFKKYTSNWIEKDPSGDIEDINLALQVPVTSKEMSKECAIKVYVEAVQANAYVEGEEEASYFDIKKVTVRDDGEDGLENFVMKSGTVVENEVENDMIIVSVPASLGHIRSGEDSLASGDVVSLKVEEVKDVAPTIVVAEEDEVINFEISLMNQNNEKITSTEEEIKVQFYVGSKNVTGVYHDGQPVAYTLEDGYVTIMTRHFSPYTISYNNARPVNKSYGFFDSYVVNEGLETEHWVHEISTVAQFRNIITNEGNTVSDSYPGYEDPKSEFVVINSIDLGGNLWADYMAEASAYIFTGTLRGVNGAVLSNYVQTTPYSKSVAIGDDPSMGLFNGSVCATFKDLTISNFSLDNSSSGKVCGLLAAGWSKISQSNILSITGLDLLADEEVLFFDCENIYIDETCSMNISANGGSIIGQGREVQNFYFKNCYSACYIQGNNGANIGGLIGSSSVWTQTTKERTYVFDECVFAGTLISNGNNIAGLSAQITCNNAVNNITVMNCDMAGRIESYYSKNIDNQTGIFIANFAKPSTLSILPTCIYENNSFSGVVIATLKAEGASGYNYEMSIPSMVDFYKEVIPANLPKVELGFDSYNRLEVTNKEALTMEYDSVLVQIKAHKHTINMAKAVDDEIKNAPYVVFNKEYETLAEMDAAVGTDAPYKVTRLGYFLPTVDTTHPADSKGVTTKFEAYMMDYSHKNDAAYSEGYHVDAEGAYFIKHNDGAAVEYVAFNDSCKNPSYFVILVKDGVPVAHGDLSKYVTNATAYGA